MKKLKTWLTSGTKEDRMFRNYALIIGGILIGIFLTVLVITVASL